MNENQRTINGKSLDQALKELRRDFPENAFKTLEIGEQSYLPIEVIIDRLDSVLSPFNWDFISSNMEMIQNGEQQNIMVIGSLTIKDDNGNNVATRSCGGGSTIIYANKTNLPTKVSNNLDSACRDALKRCAKLFGIGEDQLKDKRNAKKRNGGNGSSKAATSTETKLFTATFNSAFSTMGKDGTTAKVLIDGVEMQLVIWKEGKAIIEKTLPMAKFISSYKVGTTLSFNGYENLYQGKKQIILTDIPNKGFFN